MKNLKKKAFTLVELLVVIAIIAILAVAGVVGYVVFTKKAQQSNDTSLVSQLNEYMLAASSTDNINTVSDARDLLIEDGIDLASLKLTAKGYRAAFDIANKKFVKVNKNSPEDYSGAAEDLFVFVSNEADATTFTNAGYSVYLQRGFDSATLNVKSGVDVGENSAITAINYSTTDTKEVVICTKSAYTTVTIDAANSTVAHYGSANIINVTAVAMSSYHENGSVASLNVKAGRIKIEVNAFVGVIAVDKDATTSNVKVDNNGIVFGTEVITYKADLNHEVIDNPSDEQKAVINTVETTSTSDTLRIGNADALINLASAQSQGFVTGSLKIELTGNIDLTGRTWVPFGAQMSSNPYPFTGEIDGKNYKITGLSNGNYENQALVTPNGTTKITGYNYGFIVLVANGGSVTVKNITFENVNIVAPGAKACGVVIGGDSSYKPDSIILENINVTGTISSKDKAAGLIGYGVNCANTQIKNCNVEADISVGQDGYRAGGLIGYIGCNDGRVNEYTISNSTFKGTVTVAGNSNGATNAGALFGGATGISGGVESQATKLRITVTNFTTTASVSAVYEGKTVSGFTQGAITNSSNSVLGVLEDYSWFRLSGERLSSVTTVLGNSFVITKGINPNA